MHIQLNPSTQPVLLVSLLDMMNNTIYQNTRTKKLVIRCTATYFIYLLVHNSSYHTLWLNALNEMSSTEIDTKEWVIYEGSVTLSNQDSTVYSRPPCVSGVA